jgi:hypothetical protein
MKKLLRLLVILLLFSSCLRGPERGRVPLARVNNTYLYADEVAGMIPAGMSSDDSLALLKTYVNSWIEQQLVLDDASRNLSARQKDFNEKIKEYRNSLLIFEWEKQILNNQMDTVVTQQQLNEYYNANRHEFTLQADIVRVLYIKLNANSPFIEQSQKMILEESFNREETEQFCRKYAVNYFLDTRSWLFIEDILKEIPLNSQQRKEMETGNTFIRLGDEEYEYFLRVLDIKLKGSVSPLALEEQTIREIILQKRKNDILDRHIDNLRKSAGSSGIEIY